MSDASSPVRRGPGRPPTVSSDRVAETGLRLFLDRGFDETTMTDIAAAAGIGRKTLFGYFPNKADLVWNRFDRQLGKLTEALAHAPGSSGSTDAVVDAILRGLEMDPDHVPAMRAEVVLIQQTPALQSYAHSQGQPWRQIITEFLAEREGLDPGHVLPVVLGSGYWDAMFVGFRNWIASGDVAPAEHVRAALREYSRALTAAFAQHKQAGEGSSSRDATSAG